MGARPGARSPLVSSDIGPAPSTETPASRPALVFCVGCQHHSGRLKLEDLPDWDWVDISAHTACGKVGYVDTRRDWSEVIDFNQVISG